MTDWRYYDETVDSTPLPRFEFITREDADTKAHRAFVRGTIFGGCVIAALMFALPAFAHSWYSGACCSDKDCAPITPEHVTWTREGWRVTLGPGDHPMSASPVSEIVPFDEALPSQDSDFHACVRASVSPAAATQERIICLYIPLGDVGS